MSSTNRAFIDAYRSAVAEPTAASPVPVVGVSPPHFTSRGPKRPLSALQAEGEATAVADDEPPSTESPPLPTWPAVCQQLLATTAEQYDHVLRKLPATAASGQLIGVIGARPAAGCTTTAICLALRSAALGYSTLLVDADFVRPALAQRIGLEPRLSWAERLTTSQSVLEAVLRTEDVGVDLLLTGPTAIHQLDTTARFRASLVAGGLRRHYQRVIIDFGCPVGDDHASPAADLAAAMGIDHLLVASGPATTATDLQGVVTEMARHALQPVGMIEAA